MRFARPLAFTSVLALVACTPYVTTPPAKPQPSPVSQADARECPDDVDLPALALRHARAYGAADALAGALPVSARGTMQVEAQSGPHVLVLGKDAHLEEGRAGGLSFASGHDAGIGDWMIGGPQGVHEVLTGQEATDVAFDAFVWRRAYLAKMIPGEVQVRCAAVPGSVRVDVTFPRVEIGAPTLTFDLRSGALLGAIHMAPDGSTPRTSYEEWSLPDELGLRWPLKVTTGGPGASPTVVTHEGFVRGADCVRLGPTGELAAATGPACLARPADHAAATWPASGVVRVPMTFAAGELLFKARLGGREVLALLDSGAGISVVDATMPAASTFVPVMEIDATGATQKLRIGVGELPAVDIGGLRVTRLPTASVPIPGLAGLGDARPEVVLGYTAFAMGAVRVDYAKQEIAFARRAEDVVAKGARAVPMHALRGKLVAEADVEGVPASMILDTGNSGAFDFFGRWATPARIPGPRPKATLRGLFGAGTQETAEILFRLRHASIGPLTVDDVLAQVSEQPGASSMSGLVGNTLFARCDAVVFDHARRTLWLEGPCDRPIPAARFGWRLVRSDDEANPKRPWVLGAFLPNAAADVAGLRPGDRLLEVGGRPATSDLAPIWALEVQPEGTKIPITVLRAGVKHDVVLTLTAPLR